MKFVFFSIMLNITETSILKEEYNATFDDVWKFVPRITSSPPYGASICLIWSLPKDYLLSPDFSYTVSMKLFQVENLRKIEIFY
jgi:hypothetical protein